mmetsp:Transcript_9307/g.10154  ORF Transcript_9307/g.10154 Transcript_9307/m.10154 type:complete len:273 (+) Transcript_9307:998-1816(+)
MGHRIHFNHTITSRILVQTFCYFILLLVTGIGFFIIEAVVVDINFLILFVGILVVRGIFSISSFDRFLLLLRFIILIRHGCSVHKPLWRHTHHHGATMGNHIHTNTHRHTHPHGNTIGHLVTHHIPSTLAIHLRFTITATISNNSISIINQTLTMISTLQLTILITSPLTTLVLQTHSLRLLTILNFDMIGAITKWLPVSGGICCWLCVCLLTPSSSGGGCWMMTFRFVVMVDTGMVLVLVGFGSFGSGCFWAIFLVLIGVWGLFGGLFCFC